MKCNTYDTLVKRGGGQRNEGEGLGAKGERKLKAEGPG